MSHERFLELANAWLSGNIEGRAHDELQEALRTNGAFRAEFVELTHLDSGLRDLRVAPIPFSAPSKKAVRTNRVWAIAASLTILASIFWVSSQPSSEPGYADTYEATPERVAVLTGESGSVWEDSAISAGTDFAPGSRLILQEGLAQIDFYGGASVSLSAPAEIELVSRDRAVLHRGRIKADVPPAARGFEIDTPEVLLRDLGTSFGLAVGGDGGAELVVFDGEVRAIEDGGAEVTLFGGESARFSDEKVSTETALSREEFPDISKVFAGAGSRAEADLSRWREASLELRRDPRLIAYYDFENLTLESRRLRNRVPGDAPSELDGGIVGARVSEGRWAGKGALDFRREGDRVRFQIPGEFDALTLFAWVRIDALDRHLNSLFLTDHYDENEIHWQVSRAGAMHFSASPMGVVDLDKYNRQFFSESFWDPRDSGEWFLLATTVDRDGAGVTHYANGRALEMGRTVNPDKPLPRMRIGEADLGNWSDPIWPDRGIRTLNGRIDEFGIFSDALTAGEILSLYQTGTP